MDTTTMKTNDATETPTTEPEPILKTTVGKITYLVGFTSVRTAKRLWQIRSTA